MLFGESLGAWTSQDPFVDRGTQGLVDTGIDHAIWIGTPHFSKWKEQVLFDGRADVDPSIVRVFSNISEWHALDPEERAGIRYVMITHHDDGVALFGPELAIQAPEWLGVERVPLADVVEHPDDVTVRLRAAVEQDLLLPLAEVRRADPDRVVDPGVDESLGAPVDERILARPRTEALAEEDELRPLGLRDRREPRRQRVEQELRLLPRPSWTRSRDSTDGRAAYCIATVAQSPRASSSSAVTAA